MADLFEDQLLSDLLRNTVEELGERLDAGLLPGLYRIASVATGVIRAQLDVDGLAFTQPEAGRLPERHLLDTTAKRLIRESSRSAALRGAAAAMGGFTTLAPEAVAALVQSLRLAQRLAVVYGQDPETDKGRVVLLRALSAAWDVALPTDGNVGTSLRQLPDVVRSRLRSSSAGATVVARAIARQAVLQVGKRAGRLVPGLGTTMSAVTARRRVREQGAKMVEVYQRSWQGDLVAQDSAQNGAQGGAQGDPRGSGLGDTTDAFAGASVIDVDEVG